MTTHAEMWDTSADRLEHEAVYAERWSLVRLILEAGEGRSIHPEEVATWRPRPSQRITLGTLCEVGWNDNGDG